MQLTNGNTVRPGSALTVLANAFLAGSDFKNTTPTLAINRLQQRFGYSLPVATLIANLAGLGPQAVRS